MKELGEKFRKIIQSEFARNVLTLTSGTAFAQLIPLLLAPILSRIYSPEEFGRLALYLSIVQILGAISSGRYELAIMLPKDKKGGVQLTLLSVFITFLVSLLTLISVLIFSDNIALFLGDPKLSQWLFFVPLSVLLMGMFNALNYFNTREKEFKNIAKANVFKSMGGNITQLALGIAKFTSGGLIVGQVTSHFYGNVKMARTFLVNKDIIKNTRFIDIKELAIRYIDFPKFSMWGIFFNSTSINTVNFFISWFYGLLSLGQYSFAYKYLGFPITLIGNSVGQVYFQKLSENKEDEVRALSVFFGTIKNLFLIGVLIFVPLFFIVEELFVIVFGKEWRQAGEVAKVLLPFFFIRLIVVPITVTNSVFERQKVSFYWQIGLVILTAGIFLFAYILKLPLLDMITVQVIVLSSYYLLLIYIMWKVVLRKL